MKVVLTVTEGPHRGQVFEFADHEAFIVGRSKTAHFRLPLKDKTFSRNHFLVEVNPPRCQIVDMASTNGTFVNGRKVGAAELKDGDTIRGGATTLKVTYLADEAEDTVDVFPATPEPKPESREVPGYRITRELGRGGMGVVYLARREVDGRDVALKMITPAVSAGEQATARFLREASILRRLAHPGIVAFCDMGRAGPRFFFAMDYVVGADADALRKKAGGTLPVDRAVGLASQTLDALIYAHRQGFVHRDIKPKNLLVADGAGRDELKIADFGLARTYQASSLSGLSFTGQFCGSMGFMPPEQITDFRRAGPSVDLYGVGASLYYLLTGKRVHDFPSGFQAQVLKVLQEDPVPVSERMVDLPPRLAAVVDRSVAREPADRFPDAAAFRAALDAIGAVEARTRGGARRG